MASLTYRRLSKWLYTFKWIKQFDWRIIEFLRGLPFSSEVIGPPKSRCESTLGWVHEFASAPAQTRDQDGIEADYIEVGQTQLVPRPEPISLEKEMHWKFRRLYQTERSLPLFVATLPQGRVWNDSAVITQDDRLLSDVSVECGKLADDHSILHKWKLRPAYPVTGTAAVLTAPGGLNYCHWLYDVLPRLELIRRSGKSLSAIDRFIVNSCHLPFQKQTLSLLNIPQAKILESERYSHIKADTLVVPSLLRGHTTVGSSISQFACDFLRKEFLTDSIINASQAECQMERLYITRSTASYRKVLNEHEVIHFLDRLGFKVLVLEEMSVVEQIAAFANAKVIVAPHGAGLSNLAFCTAETKLIELFSPNYVNVCFWSVSNYIGVSYYYLLGVGARPAEYVDRPMPNPHMDDILIDIKSLAELVKLAQIE